MPKLMPATLIAIEAPSGIRYSYLSDSTGSIWAARLAGRVPKMTPTMVEVTSDTTTDQGEMLMW
jgi:hypothetical protein